LGSGAGQMVPGLESSEVSTDRIWRFSLPTNFARAFRKPLRNAPNVRTYLYAKCTRIALRDGGASVEALDVVPIKGKWFRVRARQYVLAAGGLEVPRLLLASNDYQKNGIGNDRDLVGRFYLSHLSGDLGEVVFTPLARPIVWNYEKTVDRVYCRRSI